MTSLPPPPHHEVCFGNKIDNFKRKFVGLRKHRSHIQYFDSNNNTHLKIYRAEKMVSPKSCAPSYSLCAQPNDNLGAALPLCVDLYSSHCYYRHCRLQPKPANDLMDRYNTNTLSMSHPERGVQTQTLMLMMEKPPQTDTKSAINSLFTFTPVQCTIHRISTHTHTYI
jgi:hypothetical protein